MDRRRRGRGTSSCLPADSPSVHFLSVVGRNSLLHPLAAGVFQIVLSLLMVFLFYRNGETAANRLMFTINRIGGAQGSHLLDVAGTTMRAVVYGVLGTALLQGVLAGAGFMIAGVPGAALLGFFTFVVAVIPGGPLLVAAPAVFWLYHRGSTEWAIFIAVWIVIVGNLDNVVRPFLIARGGSNTPLVLVILGVLGGAMAFGLVEKKDNSKGSLEQ